MGENVSPSAFKSYKNAEIINGSYAGGQIGLGKIGRTWYATIKYENTYIVLNEKTVSYFSRVSKKGLSRLSQGVIDTFFGALGAEIARNKAGGSELFYTEYIRFLDGKECAISCPHSFESYLKKYCNRRKVDGSASNARLENDSDAIIERCPKCHHSISSSDKFCSNCGYRMSAKRSKSLKNKPDSDEDTIRPKSVRRKRLIIRIVLLAAIALFFILALIFVFNPPSLIVQYRLDKILDKCIDNESSQECKTLQGIYKISFMYCRAYFDIPEIDKEIPVYGVAKANDYRDGTEWDAYTRYRGISYINLEDSRFTYFPYYGCVSDKRGLENKSPVTDILTDQDTVAIYELSNLPQAYLLFSSSAKSSCGYEYYFENFSVDKTLWGQIPNWKEYYDAFYSVPKLYQKCSDVSTANVALVKLNSKLTEYAQNGVVRSFYDGWSAWNEGWGGCVFNKDKKTEREFNQRCGWGQDGARDTLKDFTDDMLKFKDNEKYKSKAISD